MARDGSGTYTRVSNTFTAPVSGQTISPTDADAFWDELDTEITDSLSRTGKGGMSADLDMNSNDITEVLTINKVTITTPATGATLTIPDGTTLTGPGASGTVMTLGNNETVTGVKTFGVAGNVGKLAIAGTTSGSTILNAQAIASGTLSLPASTDTLVARASTDILSNKTIDTAAPNTIKLNGNTLTASAGTATLTFPNVTDTMVGLASVPTWIGTHTFSNATLAAKFTGGIVGINNGATTPTQPLHVGDVAVASAGTNILSARASTGATAVHGFAENSTINLSASGQGMDSFDARMVISGTQNYDHSVSYQGRTVYGSSGTITFMYGGYDGPTMNSGTVTNAYGWYAATPLGVGTITNSYGFYAEAMTRGGTLNYAFFSAGATTKSKFTGGLEGTTTNDSAAAGCIGEYIEGTRALGSASALTTGVALTIASVSLTAGDWDVGGLVYFTLNAATSISDYRGSISTTTNVLDTTLGRTTETTTAAVVPGAVDGLTAPSIGPCRFSLSGTTTVFLVARSNFTLNTNSAYGIIHARRVR